MSVVLIRDFAAADTEASAGIFDRAWHSGHSYAPRKIDSAAFKGETKSERIAVAEVEGRPVGFVSFYELQSFVHHLYVDPDFQGRGIGKALLAHAVNLMGGKASLKCQMRNPQALAFYRGLGWSEGEIGEGEFGPWVRMMSP